jgi:T5SS/PEP-CTERM-associated repeat protein
MNRIYQIVFNRIFGCAQAVPETARSCGKGKKSKAIVEVVTALGLSLGSSHLLAADTNLTGNNTVIGNGTGTVGSPLVADDLYVGRTYDGSLEVLAGGEVKAKIMFIGYYVNGSALVSGSGSRIDVSVGAPGAVNSLWIGYNGGNTNFKIEDGGKVTAGRILIDNSNLKSSKAIVTGVNSELIARAGLRIGYFDGADELRIEDSGLAKGESVIIGRESSKGEVFVTGAGSQLESESYLYLGNRGGQGTLNIQNGGTVNLQGGAGTLYMGKNDGGNGSNGTLILVLPTKPLLPLLVSCWRVLWNLKMEMPPWFSIILPATMILMPNCSAAAMVPIKSSILPVPPA